MMLPPPHPSKCQECAVAHQPDEPHDATSLYYQTQFNMRHGRGATWADAMAHCSKQTQTLWAAQLAGQFNIDIHSKNVYGDVHRRQKQS